MTEQEKAFSDLMRLRHALKAMSKSIHKTLMSGTFLEHGPEGVGQLLVKNYQKLHAKTLELFPDDFFIETLTLEIAEGTSEESQIAQVQLMTDQLSHYVENLIRELDPSGGDDLEDLKALGGNLRDQIIRMTKNTLRNALVNIEFDSPPIPPFPPMPPIPPIPHGPKGKRRVRINVEDDLPPDDDDDLSPPDDPRDRII
jgi:hypothetical protein